MAKVNLEQLRLRIEAMDRRRRQYEWKSGQPGRLARHEVWRHTYLARPYLVGAPDDRVADRFRSIFMNVMEVGPEGKLSPVPISETDEYMQTFTHMLEEYAARTGGMPPDDLIKSSREPLFRYFEHGTPIGCTMFEGYKAPTAPILVKYGKRKYLEPMFQTGQLQLANAAYYNNVSFLDAVRDDETSRTFFIPTYKERLEGKKSIDFQGHKLEFGDDDIVLPLVFDDYYLFSLCEQIHYRMPTDFSADAAIVIRDPHRFKQRLIATVLAQLPDWIAMEGKVVYYDPYRDYTKFKVPEMAKHFGYAYQKEVRVAFRPRRKVSAKLEPLLLSIGPMGDYADILAV